MKDESSTVVLEATVTVAGDPLPANNVFRKSATVLGKPHILYVEGLCAELALPARTR